GDARGGGVGGLGKAQPQPVLDIGEQLGRGKAHLRPDLAGAAQLDCEPVRQFAIGPWGEDDDRVAQRAAVLGRAERQDVDAGWPRCSWPGWMPARVCASASVPIRPWLPATGTSFSPPPKNPAAFASDVLMCAASLQ